MFFVECNISFCLFLASCVHICDDRLCLSDVQLCNGKFECADQSDEQSCPPLFQSTGASQCKYMQYANFSKAII